MVRGSGGGGLTLGAFLLASREALLLVETICLQHLAQLLVVIHDFWASTFGDITQ